jgi:uncharacterized protein
MEWRQDIGCLRAGRKAGSRLSASALLSLALCVVLGAGAVAAALANAATIDPAYQASVEKWRQNYEAMLRSDDGWFTVTGLFWLHEGDNRFGSDPLGDIVVPGKNIPAQIGVFAFHAGKVVVHAQPSAKMLFNGKPADTAELHPDAPNERLALGELAFFLHASGTRFGIRLKDKNSKARREFGGLHWFPIDPSYRVTARYTPYPAPKTVQTQNIVGDFDPYIMIGTVAFTLHGKQYQLEASENMPGAGTLFIVFRDLTSGKLTDSAARFLVAAPPKNGTVVLDFNEAYNPPCAYTAYATCPLPSPGNRMRLAIPVGEKNYKEQGD